MREEFRYIAPAPPRDTQAARTIAQAELQQLAAGIRTSATAAANALLKIQDPQGYWCGDLTADSTLESDYILLQLWLYPPEPDQPWHPPTWNRIRKAVRFILERQLSDGGWSIYEGGPSEINATARAYTAMKIAGEDSESPAMVRARSRVLSLGGLQASNSYTKMNFSLFGLYPRRYVPSVPPEILLVPGNLLYEMSSWTRTILVPLSIVQSIGSQHPVPQGLTVEELFVPGKRLTLPRRDRTSTIFNHADRLVKMWERRGIKDVRKTAVREAERWVLERLHYTDGLGAIYPAMMYTIMAMDALGYERDHPDLLDAIAQFDRLLLETEDRLQFQPCFSPVWDTAIAAFAMGEMPGGPVDAAAMTRAADWLLDREVRRKGDWSIKRPGLRPSGWAFEFANEYYPDIDDTAMVLLALQHAHASDPERQERVERRAIEWLLGMQSSDGGWAAFDVDNNWEFLNKVPFADHNAMLDPTCPDITGRVLEALCRRGFKTGDPPVQNAVRYLIANQKQDGSWYGRWGVNYIYGTFLAVRGLRASGDVSACPSIQRAAAWLQSIQNEDGGWGESCASYARHCYVPASSTPSQTAWALLGLSAANAGQSSAVYRGLRYLIGTQRPDGTWDEKLTTGTGFPNVFYLTYHLYRQYFPLLALATCNIGDN
ncbi:MAG: squalene--hopene cyclase [Bryobacterales bacterium]|nr:squalene--hopene cyclase [Bryobacterales bacterium]